jgi:GT2 family glycosyltransferase
MSASEMTNVSPLVSFVVPVLNDARRLSAALRSIQRCDYPAGRVEIVVVDNGSTDGSDEVARAAGAAVLRLPGLKVGALRNRGARATRGDAIAFVDADHEIDASWIRTAVDALRRPGTGAAGALCEPPRDATWVQRTYDLLRHRTANVEAVAWLGSGNLAVTRAAFLAARGFDESLTSCEDVDLCRRIREQGFAIVNAPGMRSVHHGDPATLSALFRGELWRARGNLRVSLRGPVHLRELPSIVIPLLDLGLLGCTAASLAGLPGVPRAAAAFALGLVALLSALRTVRMTARDRRPFVITRAFAVACVYDLARALGPLMPAPHALRRGWRR